jgi:hypothetical protein
VPAAALPLPTRTKKKTVSWRGKNPAETTVNFVVPLLALPPPAAEEREFSQASSTGRNMVGEMIERYKIFIFFSCAKSNATKCHSVLHYFGYCSPGDEAFLQTMDVGAANNVGQDTPSQDYVHAGEDEVEEDDNVVTNEGLEVDIEGLLDEAPMGRSFNYDVYEEKLIRMAWKKIGLDAVRWHRATGQSILESDEQLLQCKHKGQPPINRLYSSKVILFGPCQPIEPEWYK